MALFQIALALSVSFLVLGEAGSIDTVPNKDTLNARDAVVAAAFNLRLARLDRERAEVALEECDSRVESESIRLERDLEQGTHNQNSQALKVAGERRRQALKRLEAQAAQEGRAEEQLRRAERALALAEGRTTKGAR